MNLDELATSLHDCRRCGLSARRTQVVFGTGNPHASIMFVGEAPGFHEDKQGIPFVGAAGKLLTQLLESVGLSREEIYIANVVKCRPPDNRNPTQEEIDTCRPFLEHQVQLIQPKLVCSLGNFATQTLLGRKVGITKVRGQVFHLQQFTLFPLLHPAAALHQGGLLTPLREDFQKLKTVLESMIEKSHSPTAEKFSQIDSPASAQPVQMDLF